MKVKSIAIASVLSLLLLGVLLHFTREREAPREAPPAPAVVSAPAAIPPPPALPPARTATPEAAVKPPPAAPPARGAAIVGHVLDAESGEPIAGATVAARGSTARAETGGDGAYRLEGLPAGERYLVAAAAGHAEEHARALLEAEGPLSDSPFPPFLQDFTLQAAVELLVTVTDGEDQPLAGVAVTPAQPNGDFVRGDPYTRLTGADGKAVIPGIGRERRQQVNARKEGYREVWARDYRIEPDRDRSELAIVLEKRPAGEAVVVGRVTGPSDEPLGGVHVQWIHPHGEEKGRVVTDTAGDGSYRLEFPRVGDWCAVSAFGEGRAPSIREGVRPGNAREPAVVDFRILAGHWLEGAVTDEEGKPVPGARLAALPTIYHLRNTSLHPGNASEAATDARGRFVLRDLSGPTTALRIHGPAGREWANNFDPQVEVDRRVELKLLRWGLVRGRVLDRETGEPVPIFGIKLKKGEGYYDYPRTDPGEFFNSPQGLFVLQKLDQGPLEFLVESDGYIPRWVRDASAEPEERAAVRDVRITRGRSIEGTVVDAASGEPLSGARVVFGTWEGDLAWDEGAFAKMPDRQEAVTGADGSFRLREGEPGTLFVRRQGYARQALPPAACSKLAGASGRLRVALAPGTVLSGVLFEDGVPSRRGFLVLYRWRSGGDEGREWLGNLDRDAAGRFRIEELVPGEYLLEHWRETPGKRTGGLSIQRRVRLEAEKETSIEFGADLGPLAFQGRLLSPEGRPAIRARLVLVPAFEWTCSELAATVDAAHDGRFHFVGLRPGTYRLEAIVADSARKVELGPLEVEGDLERDVEMPAE